MARKFFYVCAGILMLALSYHFGAQSASAQSSANPVVGSIPVPFGTWYNAVVTANGDVYGSASPAGNLSTWTYVSNVFTGSAPTAAQQESFGSLKAKFRK
jgi:hypothetical protein